MVKYDKEILLEKIGIRCSGMLSLYEQSTPDFQG